MCPSTFNTTQSALYRLWVKKIEAYTNSKRNRFREELEQAEKTKSVIDDIAVRQNPWQEAIAANGALYDMLVSVTQGDAQELVEMSPGQGFDAWRRLHERYNPIGEM